MEVKNDNAPKIMHFVHWSRSGITSLVKSLIRNSSGRYEYFLLLFLDDDNFEQYYKGIERKAALKANDGYGKALFRAVRHYRRFQPDIVHVHSFTPLMLSCLLFWESKLVFHVHNDYPYFHKYDLKSICKRGLIRFFLKTRHIQVVAVSRDIKGILNNHYNADAKFIMNAVPGYSEKRGSFTSQLPTGKFFTVARLSRQKNIELGIRIIKELIFRNLQVTLDVYGEGEEVGRLRDLVDTLSLENFVKLKGFVKHPETLAPHYDYYLSTSWYEGVGLSIIEALRGCNLVVMTPVGDLVNVLKDQETAAFISHDLQEATEKIIHMMKMPTEKKDRMQKRGYQVYLNFFMIDKFILQIETLYAQLLRAGRDSFEK